MLDCIWNSIPYVFSGFFDDSQQSGARDTKVLPLSQGAITDLSWWVRTLRDPTACEIRLSPADMTIDTDAGPTLIPRVVSKVYSLSVSQLAIPVVVRAILSYLKALMSMMITSFSNSSGGIHVSV